MAILSSFVFLQSLLVILTLFGVFLAGAGIEQKSKLLVAVVPSLHVVNLVCLWTIVVADWYGWRSAYERPISIFCLALLLAAIVCSAVSTWLIRGRRASLILLQLLPSLVIGIGAYLSLGLAEL